MSKIFIIGGATRTGKTILADRIAKRLSSQGKKYILIPTTSIRGAMNLDAMSTSAQEQEELSNLLLRYIVACLNYRDKDIIVHGVHFHPGMVIQLNEIISQKKNKISEDYSNKNFDLEIESVNSIFLGTKDLSVGEITHLIANNNSIVPWHLKTKIETDYISKERLRMSKVIEMECNELGLNYIDLGIDWDNGIQEAENILFS